MARNKSLWQDEYWLLLMQLYLKKPQGLKPMYSKGMVDLALELHIPPQELYDKMFRLRSLDTPRLEKMWEKYSKSPKLLAKGVRMLRQMKGLGSAGGFFDGVEIQESWESELRSIDLILILDLYFRLVPNSMVVETPEVQQLARLIKMKPKDVVEVMMEYRRCESTPKYEEQGTKSEEIWQRYGNDNPEKLAALAAQLEEYYRK